MSQPKGTRRKPESELRTHPIRVMVNEAERAQLEKASAGLSLAVHLRTLGLAVATGDLLWAHKRPLPSSMVPRP